MQKTDSPIAYKQVEEPAHDQQQQDEWARRAFNGGPMPSPPHSNFRAFGSLAELRSSRNMEALRMAYTIPTDFGGYPVYKWGADDLSTYRATHLYESGADDQWRDVNDG